MVCKFYFNMLLYQITFIYIVLFTIQIVSKQLHSDNIKKLQQRLFLRKLCQLSP